MIAFVQKHHGEYANINVLTAAPGFREKGYLVEHFEWPELESLALEGDSLVVGGIPVVLNALRRFGIVPPELPSVPESLTRFARRRVWTTTFAEARQYVIDGQPVFIKPLASDRKLFAGHVLSSFRDSIQTASIPDDYPVSCSEPVSFAVEYRVFVIDREIVGIRYYKGDFRIFPDFSVIDSGCERRAPDWVARRHLLIDQASCGFKDTSVSPSLTGL